MSRVVHSELPAAPEPPGAQTVTTVLKKDPPHSIARRLRDEGVSLGELLLCTDTDIDPLGRYTPQWLIVTARSVRVMDTSDAAHVLIELPFEQVQEFRSEGVVGSGLLQARIGGVSVDVLRYSNRLADKFEKVARKLHHYLRGEPITLEPDEPVNSPHAAEQVSRAAMLWRMWKMMGAYRPAAAGIMGMLVIGISLDLIAPQLTRILVDDILPGSAQQVARLQSDPGAFADHRRNLIYIVGVLVAVAILRSIVNIVNGRLGARVGTGITFDLRKRLVNHLQQLSVSYYDRHEVGSLVGRALYDTEALHDFVHQLTGGFVFQLLLIVGVGIMMFSMDVELAFYTLLPAPLVIVGAIFFWRFVYPLNYRLTDASSKQAGMLSGMLAGIRVVKAFGQENRELGRFEQASDNLRQARWRMDRGSATFNPIMGLAFQLGGWIVWYAGGERVLNGRLTMGELMAFFGYLWMFYGPLATLTQLTNWLTRFATQSHRIFEVLDAPDRVPEPQQPVPIPTIEGRIEFQGVTFGYSKHTPVLRDVSIAIEPGELIGIVGRSGSGKTTLINLLSRFYDVDEGRVLIDGVDVRHVSKTELRRQIGVVLQEPFLFHGTIWENMIYGRPGATPEEVIAASKAANCHDFVLKHDHAYETWVGERGAGLSGGERQRVSIARVLLTDPRILILDEATSSVDAESETAIHAALAELIRGRTTLAIAHRLSTLRNAHRILVVDGGRIDEFGPHDELLARNGLYAHLMSLQGHATALERQALGSLGEEGGSHARTTDPAAPSHHPRWLDPLECYVRFGPHGVLELVHGQETYSGVFALRCFPVKRPGEFISLRYLGPAKREEEIGLIRDLRDWPRETQRLIGDALARRYFVHVITSVHRVEALHGFLHFEVDTDLGPRDFYIANTTERVQQYGDRGKILVDADDNHYCVPDVQKLPDADRRRFQRHIYW